MKILVACTAFHLMAVTVEAQNRNGQDLLWSYQQGRDRNMP